MTDGATRTPESSRRRTRRQRSRSAEGISTLPQCLNAWAFRGLLALLVWAPWPLGSNRPWALSILAAGCWGLLMLALVARLLGPVDDSWRRLHSQAYVPLLSLAAFCLWVALQLVPGLGPLVADGRDTLTIGPFNTRSYLLASLLYLGSWLLVLLTVRSRERARGLLGALVAAGVLQAFGAVLLHSANTSYQLFLTTFDPTGRATGTFPSPDNLAGYMELCLAAGLGWLLSQMGQGAKSGAGWRARTVSVLSFMMSGKMLLRLLLVVMVIALVMSHSRMGNGAFFIGLALTGATVAVASRELRKSALWLVASMVLVDIVVVGQWVGIDRVVQRMQDTAVTADPHTDSFGLGTPPQPREETIAERLTIPLMSLRLVADSPWFGHGGGTYYTAFPRFKEPSLASIGLFWDHAHNDYVQVAADTGWVGLAFWMLVGVATAWRAVQLLADGQSRVNRGFGVAAVMALFCMGLHNLVDFNLHIPSNALTFTVLLAAVWTTTESPARQRSAAWLVLAVPVAAWVFWEAQRTFRADLASASARQHVATWVGGAESPKTAQDWNEAQAALLEAIGITPDDPDLHERLGDLHVVAGRRDWERTELRRIHFGHAADAYRQALVLRPGEPATWAMLAMVDQVLGTDPARVHKTWAMALACGPNEAHTRPILLQIVLAGWNHATPEMQAWAKTLFDQGDATTRATINKMAEPYGLLFTPDTASAS